MLYSIFRIYEFPDFSRHRQQCKQGKEIKEIFNPVVGTFHKTQILKLGRVPCPKEYVITRLTATVQPKSWAQYFKTPLNAIKKPDIIPIVFRVPHETLFCPCL